MNVFNGNRVLSPVAVAVAVFGICLMAVVPPLGFVVLVYAAAVQGLFRARHTPSKHRIAQLKAEQAAAERQDSIRAWKAVP